MREKLSKILHTFQQDYLRLILGTTNLALAISMIVSPEPHNLFFWITLAFRIITVPVAIFIGNKGLWICYFIFCNVGTLQTQYDNFSYVALLMVLFSLTPKVTKRQAVFVVALYVTDVFIVAGMRDKEPYYIWNHFILSAQYCTAMWRQKVINQHYNKTAIRILKLTEEEIEILEQLKNNETIKEVDGSCERNVYRKLEKARERNSITSNAELIQLYKSNCFSV